MKVSFESKGDFENALRWLKSVVSAKPSASVRSIADEGKQRLISGTPKNTGKTASGWDYKITTNRNHIEIVWMNKAHPELDVNLAKLIELGHGTKNGGYVPPNPYIKQSMDSVFKSAGDKIAGEMFK